MQIARSGQADLKARESQTNHESAQESNLDQRDQQAKPSVAASERDPKQGRSTNRASKLFLVLNQINSINYS